MMLLKLLKSHRDRYDCQVISLTGRGPIADSIEALGIPVRVLHLSPSFPNPLAILRLARWLRADRPDLIQTWMYHADLVGGLASWLGGQIPLVWGIHNTTLEVRQTKARTRAVVRLNGMLSRWLPDRIISCSKSAQDLHRQMGFDSTKISVIPNGFELQDFKADAAARRWLRSELGLRPDALIIGHVGRYNPQKDYPTLLSGAEYLRRSMPDAHFVLCGQGVENGNSELRSGIEERGLAGHAHLLGRRDDIARVMAGFDLGTLSSAYGEAFPNVIGEMMSCEVPCVVTDVGDSGEMIGDTGLLVPARNPQALADAWKAILLMPEEERRSAGKSARERVQQHYSLAQVAQRYEEVYQSLIKPDNKQEIRSEEHGSF